MQLSLLDLLTILSIIPVVEFVVTKFLICYRGETTPFPITALLPCGYATVWLVGNLENPYFLIKLSGFLNHLFSVEHLFVNFVYLGVSILSLQIAVGTWQHKAAIVRCLGYGWLLDWFDNPFDSTDTVFRECCELFVYQHNHVWKSCGSGDLIVIFNQRPLDYRLYMKSSKNELLLNQSISRKTEFQRDLIRNMFRWTNVDQSTQQPKLVSFCVQWPNKSIADKFDMAVHQAILNLAKEELEHRGQRGTYGVGEAILSKPRSVLSFRDIPSAPPPNKGHTSPAVPAALRSVPSGDARSKNLPAGRIYTEIVLDSDGMPYNNVLANKRGVKYQWDLFGRRFVSGPNGEKYCDPMYTNQGQLLVVDNCGNRRIAGCPMQGYTENAIALQLPSMPPYPMQVYDSGGRRVDRQPSPSHANMRSERQPSQSQVRSSPSATKSSINQSQLFNHHTNCVGGVCDKGQPEPAKQDRLGRTYHYEENGRRFVQDENGNKFLDPYYNGRPWASDDLGRTWIYDNIGQRYVVDQNKKRHYDPDYIGPYSPYPAPTGCYQYNPWTHKVKWNCDPDAPLPTEQPLVNSNVRNPGVMYSNYPQTGDATPRETCNGAAFPNEAYSGAAQSYPQHCQVADPCVAPQLDPLLPPDYYPYNQHPHPPLLPPLLPPHQPTANHKYHDSYLPDHKHHDSYLPDHKRHDSYYRNKHSGHKTSSSHRVHQSESYHRERKPSYHSSSHHNTQSSAHDVHKTNSSSRHKKSRTQPAHKQSEYYDEPVMDETNEAVASGIELRKSKSAPVRTQTANFKSALKKRQPSRFKSKSKLFQANDLASDSSNSSEEERIKKQSSRVGAQPSEIEQKPSRVKSVTKIQSTKPKSKSRLASASSKVVTSQPSKISPKASVSPKASATAPKPPTAVGKINPAKTASQGSALGSTAKDSLVKAHKSEPVTATASNEKTAIMPATANPTNAEDRIKIQATAPVLTSETKERPTFASRKQDKVPEDVAKDIKKRNISFGATFQKTYVPSNYSLQSTESRSCSSLTQGQSRKDNSLLANSHLYQSEGAEHAKTI